MARTIINTPIGKTLFERLLNSKANNKRLLSDLVSLNGYLCDHGNGVIRTDANNSVVEIHLKNSYKSITLKILKNDSSNPSYVRVCRFNDKFIKGTLEFYGNTIGKTTTFNLEEGTKIVKITTETVNLKNYEFYFK